MEKCECEKAKDYLDETTKNPIQYHFPYDYGSHHLRDILEAEMYYEERRFRCACRKRRSQETEQANEEQEEPVCKKLNVSDVDAEDGSGSERETTESEVEEEGKEDAKSSATLPNTLASRDTLDTLLPNNEGPLSCRLCELARASLAEAHVTGHAIQLFEEVKKNCSRCNGRAREEVLCHCAENFEWTINFASKDERLEMGWDLGWELDD